MMGIGPADYDTVFNASNVILSNGDPEYVAEGEDPMLAFMNAAQQLNLLMVDLAQYRKDHPTDDVTSALVNTNVDGEALTDAELASFFILLVVAGNETTRNAISHGLLALTRHPDQRAPLAGRHRWRGTHCGRRDRALGLAGHLDAAHGRRGHRAGRSADVRRRPGHPVLQLGQSGRRGVREPLHVRRAPSSRTPTSGSEPPARISVWARTWPARRST